MNKNTKLKLRSEKGSVQGEPLSASYLQDSSFSNDERASIERSNSVRGAYGGTSGLNYTGPTYFHSQMLATPQYGTGQPIAYMLAHLDTIPNTREFPIFPPMMPFLQFKTIECTVKNYHDHKQCPLFHSSKDHRRCPQKHRYEPDLCPEVAASKVCTKYENCNYSHSTVEQFYHPKKFKTKFCSGIVPGSKGGKCIYASFCSFAHSESELRIKKLHQMEKTPDFFRYHYKTVYCPFNHPHDKSSCEYAHNVQDYRRDPATTAYLPETCRKWNGSAEINKYEDGGCNYNEACNKCHGWKELEYHPKFYKTKQCTHGEKCSRADCGYLHPYEQSKQSEDFFSERKFKESIKDSITSASIRVKGKLTVSQSQQSSSKDDRLLTFNSSSRSVLGNNDSLMVKKDENDRADLDSIVGEPQPMKLHARTELGNHEEDDSADDSLYNDGRNVRKFSVETVIGGSEDRFLLKSEAPKLDFSKTFISPLKLMRFYGPKSPLESKTMTASPSMSSLTLTSQTEDETLDSEHLAKNIMQKHSLTEASLLHEDFPELHQHSTITDGEMKHLLSWRDVLLDGKREKDLRQIIEDYPVQDKCFKKW